MKCKWLMACLSVLICVGHAAAEEAEGKRFSANVDADLFLINNEFNTLLRGYTLPGFRFTPTLSYRPTERIKLEGGVYMLHYWGANNYPNTNYLFIPDYSETNNSKGVHALPFLRLEGTTDFGLTVVAGNIYGQSHHRLLPQLYAPELEMTADPEAGLQLLYSCRWIDLDAWIDWRKFIYNNSPSRENFFVGLSTQFRFNQGQRGIEVYSPLQLLIEHRGGEIDTNVEPGINTLLNAALGVGARYHTGNKGFQSIGLEIDGLVSDQVAGKAWPYDNGWACYGHIDAKGWGFEATMGIYHAHQYVSVLGLPLWGVVSTATEGMVLKDPNTAYIGLKYQYEFAKGYTLSADVQWYELLGCDKIESGSLSKQKATSNFVMGVTFTATPSWRF